MCDSCGTRSDDVESTPLRDAFGVAGKAISFAFDFGFQETDAFARDDI